MAKKLDVNKLMGRLKELNESSGGQNNGMSFLSIKDGRNVVRILPPSDNMESFGEEVWVHYSVGKSSSNKNGTMVVCPKTKDENAKCPVCEASKELWNLSKKKDDDYQKQAKQLNRKKRVYYNAIDRAVDLSLFELREEDDKKVWYNTETNEKESPIKILGTGVGVYKDLIKLIVDPEYGDVTDPKEGLDIIITKSGSGQFNTEYDVKTVRKESAIGMDDWEEHLNDLEPLTKAKTYDEILTIMEGGEPTESSEDESKGDDQDDSADTGTEGGSGGDEDLEDEIQAAIQRRRNK